MITDHPPGHGATTHIDTVAMEKVQRTTVLDHPRIDVGGRTESSS
jgi:hypothetical protein